MTAVPQSEFAGDPRHPDHAKYLYELGRATYAAAGVACIAFDILRIHDGVRSAALYDDPLGTLVKRLRQARKGGVALPDFESFIVEIERARVLRNDLIHALPVAHGLHRRTSKDLGRVVTFYTVESLFEATRQFEAVRARGNALLYSDGGAAIRAWYQRAPSEA